MFICFEGIDGAGKSTQARMLYEHLTADGYRAELVCDPGTTKIGTAIRSLLLDNDAPITPVAQMLLFSAARAELAAYIKQQIKNHVVVICDRWFLSTLVYQGEMNKLPLADLLAVFSLSGCMFPDLCFLLDLPPDSAQQRIGPPRDRYERKNFEDRARMRAAYIKFAQNDFAVRNEILNAAHDADTIHRLVYSLVAGAIKDCPEILTMEYSNANADGARNCSTTHAN